MPKLYVCISCMHILYVYLVAPPAAHGPVAAGCCRMCVSVCLCLCLCVCLNARAPACRIALPAVQGPVAAAVGGASPELRDGTIESTSIHVIFAIDRHHIEH